MGRPHARRTGQTRGLPAWGPGPGGPAGRMVGFGCDVWENPRQDASPRNETPAAIAGNVRRARPLPRAARGPSWSPWARSPAAGPSEPQSPHPEDGDGTYPAGRLSASQKPPAQREMRSLWLSTLGPRL